MPQDGYELRPRDLSRWSDAAAEAGRSLAAASDPAAPRPGSFGAVTHSALIEQLARDFAEVGVADRLRSSEADADQLADTLRGAAADYVAVDAEGADRVRRTMPGPEAEIIT